MPYGGLYRCNLVLVLLIINMNYNSFFRIVSNRMIYFDDKILLAVHIIKPGDKITE